MSYTTTPAIASEFKKITFDADTSVTAVEVDGFIDELEAFMNGRLATRFQTPVADPEAVKILKMISTGLTVCRVQDILQVRTGQAKTDKDLVRPKICKDAEKWLDQIVDGQIILQGALLQSSDDGFSSGNADNDVTPFFKRGVDQY